ncbi:MAG: hypothetical protein ACFE9S_06980 [Candidatus Hermodarchaeota archaeon]
MSVPLKTYESLKLFRTIQHNQIRYQAPLILKMFGALNKINMRNENRYILCNFLDQYSDLIGLTDDIYKLSNHVTLNQLFLFAINKAKEKNLIVVLYNEYINSIDAIDKKLEFNHEHQTL